MIPTPDPPGHQKKEFCMSAKIEFVTEAGLQFYGKMTASISHEIKNVLAIVNENAGLLEDLAFMADGGAAIEPQRLKNMSRAVMKQVSRADAIMKNMNRLAHSVDESVKTIDLNDILELLVALSARFASMRGVTVQPKLNEGPLKLTTSPFFLMNLLWLCLDFAMDAAGEDKIVELFPQKTEAGVQVFFKSLGGLTGAPLQPFPTEPENELCGLLAADLEVNPGNREIVVRIAENIDRD
jgi:C4-dicarboxylate-specific signal transduction histidine kinase